MGAKHVHLPALRMHVAAGGAHTFMRRHPNGMHGRYSRQVTVYCSVAVHLGQCGVSAENQSVDRHAERLGQLQVAGDCGESRAATGARC